MKREETYAVAYRVPGQKITVVWRKTLSAIAKAFDMAKALTKNAPNTVRIYKGRPSEIAMSIASDFPEDSKPEVSDWRKRPTGKFFVTDGGLQLPSPPMKPRNVEPQDPPCGYCREPRNAVHVGHHYTEGKVTKP